MALLTTWPGLLLPIMLLSACAGAPLPTRSAVASPDIGWVDRQFRICGGKECPAPTRKTLALVDIFPAQEEASPALPEAPQVAVPPANEAEPPSVIIRFPFAGSRPTAEGRQRLHRLVQRRMRFLPQDGNQLGVTHAHGYVPQVAHFPQLLLTLISSDQNTSARELVQEALSAK